MEMDIASLSTALATQDLQTTVGVAVAKLGMDTMEQNSENLIENMKAMELSVMPHLGSHFDARI